MKKVLLVLLLAVFTLSSCSNDDSAPVQETVYMRVLTMSAGSAPGDPIVYQINYGTKIGEDEVSTVVSQEVFEYYQEKFIASPSNKPRWRGMVTHD